MTKEISSSFSRDYPLIYEDKETFNQVLALFNKDLYLCGITDFNFSDSSPDEFIKELNDFISFYIKSHTEQLRAFLYRIDVKETDIVKAFESSESDEVLNSAFARLILLRLIEKVLNRKNY